MAFLANKLIKNNTVAVINVSLCIAANTSLDELDLSWNCFRRRSAVALIKGLEVTAVSMRCFAVTVCYYSCIMVAFTGCKLREVEDDITGRGSRGF